MPCDEMTMEKKMQNRWMRMTAMGLACLPLLLVGCGDMNVKKYIPFTGDTIQERSRTPPNATEFQCAAGKRFYVRTLEGGAAVWLILPEREVRLEKLGADAGMRYSNGIAVLDINGNEASLKDGTAISLAGCKAASSP
jgi:membrane-bound inhibitor of C-type lysozyme